VNDTSTHFIQLRGLVGEVELNATSPLEMTALWVETAATTFSVCTDQAGLIGLVRHLHSRGHVLWSVTSQPQAVLPGEENVS